MSLSKQTTTLRYHAYLSEVTGMILVPQSSVMVGTTSKTTTTGVASVLTDTTVTGRDVASLFSVGVKSGRLNHKQTNKQIT